MKTTKEAVIKATSDLADEKGLNNVSLKAVAQKLNIRTPSLYNHIESLDNLLLEVAPASCAYDNTRNCADCLVRLYALHLGARGTVLFLRPSNPAKAELSTWLAIADVVR